MRGDPLSTYHQLVEARDKDCRVTGWEKCCQVTHLVPQAPGEEEWVSSIYAIPWYK